MNVDAPARTPPPAWSAPARWLPWACVLVAGLALGKAPTLDEESYLWFGRTLDPRDPYALARAWPPWDAADGYVYAHPPLYLLWMRLLAPLQGALPLLRAVAGLPFAWLLGWAVARLAAATTHHPARAALGWLASATVVLGLQNTLMIDLPAVALATAGLAVWRDALAPDGALRRGAWVAGALLGAAVCVKYSMGVLLPVLALHAWRARERPGVARAGALAVGVALGALLLVEGALALRYGRVHLLEVWARREAIPSGPWMGRSLGVLARAALLPCAGVLFLARPGLASVGAGVGVAASVLVGEPLSAGQATLLVGCCALGGALLARAGEAVLRGGARRRKGDRDDALLLGAWVLAVTLGVGALHNFASARYLLPAAAPAALLVARSAEEVRLGKGVLAWTSVAWALLAGALALADARFAAAGTEVAAQALAEVARRADGPATTSAAAGGSAGPREVHPVRFSGEWSFRHAMEASGAVRLRPGEGLSPCQWWVGVDSTGGGEVPESAEPVARVETTDTFPLRVVDGPSRAGLYAETLGPLPFGWDTGPRRPLEGATLRRAACP